MMFLFAQKINTIFFISLIVLCSGSLMHGMANKRRRSLEVIRIDDEPTHPMEKRSKAGIFEISLPTSAAPLFANSDSQPSLVIKINGKDIEPLTHEPFEDLMSRAEGIVLAVVSHFADNRLVYRVYDAYSLTRWLQNPDGNRRDPVSLNRVLNVLYYMSSSKDSPLLYIGSYKELETNSFLTCALNMECLHERQRCAQLGRCYTFGEQVEQNYEIARVWLEHAARHGSTSALCNLGFLFHKGLGVRTNFKKASEYYDQASALGSLWADFNLAVMHERGQGVPRNTEKAGALYSKILSMRSDKTLRTNARKALVHIITNPSRLELRAPSYAQ